MRTKAHLLASLYLVFILLLSIAVASFGIDDVTLHLKWLHGAQFAGYYAAVDQGYYAAEDLEVRFLEGATDYQEYYELASGTFDFLVGDALRLIQAVENHVPVKAIAAVYQFDPLVLFSLAESEIVTPYDLFGKRIMSWNSVMLEALIHRMGMTMDDINAGGTSYDITQLWDGTFDVWMGYLTNEVVRTRDAGFEINIIYPTDYGIHIYGDVLVTTSELIERNPDLVQRFLRASLRGWEYVSQNTIPSASLASTYNPELDSLHEVHAVEASLPLLHGGVAHIGWMDRPKWNAIARLMYANGRTERLVDASHVFTRQFLDGIYGEVGQP